MTTLFWVLIVIHVFLCLFLSLLVLVQNDKMGGLAGLGGMTSQSAFSTAGAATFIQKLTRVVAVIFFIVVFALGLITAKKNVTVEESAMQKATRENAAQQQAPVPALPGDFAAPAVDAPAAPAADAPAPGPSQPDRILKSALHFCGVDFSLRLRRNENVECEMRDVEFGISHYTFHISY